MWSPRSNSDLYGQTTDIPVALNLGVDIALGPDWTPSGSLSQLQEMRCAAYVSDEYWDGIVSDEQLVHWTTDQAAKVMAIDDQIGKLEVDYLADVVVIATDEEGRRFPFRTIRNAEAWDVRMTMIGGEPVYGDTGFAPHSEFCETLDVCSHEKFICVKQGEDATDLKNQTLVDVKDRLEAAITPLRDAAVDADKYMFEVLPLFFCPETPEYAADQPEQVCTFKHNPHPDVIFPAIPATPIDNDSDQDGIADADDNCPLINNADQLDADDDGAWDACDEFVLSESD